MVALAKGLQMVVQHTIDTPYPVGSVHCYTLESEDGLILFDTGPPTEEAKEYLRSHLDFSRLRHIFITHCHVDHYGLAYWLLQETDATVYLPQRDALKFAHNDRRLEMMGELLGELGFDSGYRRDLRRIFDSGALFPPFPRRFKIAETESPPALGLEIIPCPGHSQSDIVYASHEWAVTGDTLLRGIFQSPLLDIDLMTGKRFNNYHAYCTSIVRLASLGGRMVLPGHRRIIENVLDIIRFYVCKVFGRVEQLLPMKDERNVARLIAQLFNNGMTDVFHIYLKTSEIVFMQDFLQQPEVLKNALVEIGLFDNVAMLYKRAIGG